MNCSVKLVRFCVFDGVFLEKEQVFKFVGCFLLKNRCVASVKIDLSVIFDGRIGFLCVGES